MIRIPATSVTDEVRAPMLPLSRPRSCYGSVARRSPIVLQELVLYSCIYWGAPSVVHVNAHEVPSGTLCYKRVWIYLS